MSFVDAFPRYGNIFINWGQCVIMEQPSQHQMVLQVPRDIDIIAQSMFNNVRDDMDE
jgi:hypothetical protein